MADQNKNKSGKALVETFEAEEMRNTDMKLRDMTKDGIGTTESDNRPLSEKLVKEITGWKAQYGEDNLHLLTCTHPTLGDIDFIIRAPLIQEMSNYMSSIESDIPDTVPQKDHEVYKSTQLSENNKKILSFVKSICLYPDKKELDNIFFEQGAYGIAVNIQNQLMEITGYNTKVISKKL